jgi:Na+(H+)/acetate symporter ActP
MIVKLIWFVVGLTVIGMLFLIQNAFTRPIYNKMHNMWHDDPEGRKIGNIVIALMVLIGFLLGLMF